MRQKINLRLLDYEMTDKIRRANWIWIWIGLEENAIVPAMRLRNDWFRLAIPTQVIYIEGKVVC